MWRKTRAGQATDDNITWEMRFASWNTKPTEPDSEYVILIAFARQQCLHERASLLRCTCINCLVILCPYLRLGIQNGLFP